MVTVRFKIACIGLYTKYIYIWHFYFPASGQAVDTGVVPSPPQFLPSFFIAHRVQQSHCSSIFHRVLLTHALGLSQSQFAHKKKSLRICTSMHSGGLELTKLSYTRLEDNLIRHRGDRITTPRHGPHHQPATSAAATSAAATYCRFNAGCSHNLQLIRDFFCTFNDHFVHILEFVDT